MSLRSRGAVVTGGGRGIGAAVARALAGAGAAVVVAARSADEVAAVAAALRADGGEAHAVTCDVSDPDSVAALARVAAERVPTVDVLVNAAGIAHSNPVLRITLEEWQQAFAVNATGTFLCTQAFLAPMLERGWGRIVNVASVVGLAGGRYVAAYSASKHAVVGFTRSLALEVEGRGVTANAVCPGYVDTAMTEATLRNIRRRTGMSAEAALAAVLEAGGQSRLIGPDEVARAVLSLCVEEAGAVNGTALVVDGGGAHTPGDPG